MPKHTRSSSSTHNPYAHAMPVSLAPSQPMDIGYNARQQHMSLNTAFYQTMPNNVSAQAAMASQAYEPYPTVPAAAAMPQSIPHRASSGAWSPQDDKNLIAARQQGLNWNQIQVNYFPNKTSNACRKRHERLMERKGADDWDARKLERIAREYVSMRKEIWQPLAQRVGEKWSVVEARCMNNGLKNIQNAARAGARRERVESGQGQVFTHGYDDDSGISGIGLTPVDDLDASYSSPETTSSGSLSGGSYHGGIPMQLGHQAYNQHYTTNAGGLSSGYSSSVSSTTAQAYGQMTGQSHHSSGGSPYLGHGQRLPSVDMGIDAIINRPGGHNGPPSSI